MSNEISPEELERYRQIRERDEAFTKWRKEKTEILPELAARIFALRGKGYMGCGFHWGLEKELGVVICQLNDYDGLAYYNSPEAIQFQIVLKLRVKHLEKRVNKIEKSLLTPTSEE